MNRGSPTVKWLSLFLLLIFSCSLLFVPYSSDAQDVPRSKEKLSPDLPDRARDTSSERVTVIIQFNGSPGSSFDSFLLNNSGHEKAA
jgi:hypothetical protein